MAVADLALRVIGSAVLLAAAATLGMAGQVPLAIGLALVVVVNATLLFVYGQGARKQLAVMTR